MRSPRHFAVLLCVAVLGASCGTGAKPSASTQTPGPSKARDRDRAGALAVTRLDLPAGWKAIEASGGLPKNAATEKAFEACVREAGFEDMPDDYEVLVDGKTIGKGLHAVGSSVTYAGTEAAAKRSNDAWVSSKLISCVAKGLRRLFADGFAKNKPPVSVLSMTGAKRSQRRIGDAARRVRFVLTTRSRGVTVRLYLDVVEILKDRARVTVMFMGFGTPVAASLQQRVLGRVAKRLSLA